MNTYDPNYVHQDVFAIVGQKAVIVNDLGEVLLLQRSEKAGAGGQWSFPGGALDDKENPYEGIKREIREETQLEVSDIAPFYVRSYSNKENKFVVIIAYTCAPRTTEVILNWEHNNYKWMTKDAILAMDLTQDARFVAEHFENSPAVKQVLT